jgi:hypothetical protein
MLNTPGHKENVNQNDIEIPSPLSQNSHHLEDNAGEDRVFVSGRSPYTLLVGM